MANRKDNKGRVLHKGEGQRKIDNRYFYRYTDPFGKRRDIYALTLEELRIKENKIQRMTYIAKNYAEGSITMLELVERYVSLKRGVRHSTKVGYNFVLNILKKESFAQRQIYNIRTSDVKLWFMKLQQDGRGYSTLTSIRGVLKPAFQMAYEEDILPKNPFDFQLSGVIVNTSQKRIAMTPEQQSTFMEFVRTDRTYCKYYDEFIVLLETGLRVSEFCGLTMRDLDFEARKICVDHQLLRDGNGIYHIEKTKSESGCRYIPMTDNVYNSLRNILAMRVRPKVEWFVDGHSKFILLDKNSNPKVALHIENEMRWALKKYHKLHPDNPLPHITPHVFRHTFCTNMANAGMDIKSLQYLMGHSDASITMNVYSHSSYAHAEKAMLRIADGGSINKVSTNNQKGDGIDSLCP